VNHVCDAAGGSGSNGYQKTESAPHSDEHGAGLPPGARDVPEPAMQVSINICRTKWLVIEGGTAYEFCKCDMRTSQRC
jgi:hypothetical protein